MRRKPRGFARRSASRSRIDSILMRRKQLVAEAALLIEQGRGSSFVEKAEQLLTRWWARASWNAREHLLVEHADWLIRIENRREQT